MKEVCIKGDILDVYALEHNNREDLLAAGFKIVEVDESYIHDCHATDFDSKGFNIDLYNKRHIRNNTIATIADLVRWFDEYFVIQLQQHSWQKDYKPSKDPHFKNEDGTPKIYATFEEVVEQAEIVREEIKNLRKKINNAK